MMVLPPLNDGITTIVDQNNGITTIDTLDDGHEDHSRHKCTELRERRHSYSLEKMCED